MVPFLDLAAMHDEMRSELDEAINRVLSSSSFVLGDEVAAFEEEFADFVGAAHCVGVGNGLDAIHLALRAVGVGPGDEVLVPSHTFIATWLGVSLTGAVPVPVEPATGRYVIDATEAQRAVTSKTRAVLPVHLYGEPADLGPLRALCAGEGLVLLEDAAQAHGASYQGQRIGGSGTATWSFYPGKNLGALGDAGAVTTDSAAIATELRMLRNYGCKAKYIHDVFGVNSRLDELQAAVLRVKLRHLERHQERRQIIANRYLSELADLPLVLPQPANDVGCSWHLFVVRSPRRNALQAALTEAGVRTQIHYPLAVHQQGAYAGLGLTDSDLPVASAYATEVLSLPIGPGMTDAEVDAVIGAVHACAPATAEGRVATDVR